MERIRIVRLYTARVASCSSKGYGQQFWTRPADLVFTGIFSEPVCALYDKLPAKCPRSFRVHALGHTRFSRSSALAVWVKSGKRETLDWTALSRSRSLKRNSRNASSAKHELSRR